ncbi:hypothetical protein V9L05_03500 [Bernardetia sp. Wsw4-3y2]|uniref:hypothetical protein n=1 Tax=Bernardetia sp. Wsw4-3y2 TaxID=3127471 RepID=UPI0030D44E26
MRKIIVFAILFLICPFTTISSNSIIDNKDDFSIEIEESAMLRHSNFKISQDCIILEVWLSPDEPKYYSKVVSKADRKAITDLLDKIEFDSLRKGYYNHSIDDMLEYTFKFKYKNVDREIHIYDMKVKPIFDLVAKINTLLPLEFRINYDDSYFSRK